MPGEVAIHTMSTAGMSFIWLTYTIAHWPNSPQRSKSSPYRGWGGRGVLPVKVLFDSQRNEAVTEIFVHLLFYQYF